MANNRFKFKHTLTPEVRQAMDQLAEMFRTGAEEIEWNPHPDATYRVDIILFLPTMRGDLDGPIKRLIDASFRGLRQYRDVTWINDGRVIELHAEKIIGPPTGFWIRIGQALYPVV
jgi:hypothetical protein